MEQYIINKEGIEALFNIIKQSGKKIVAPVLRNNRAVYAAVTDFAQVTDDFIQTVNSAKEVAFPRTEKLFAFTKDNNGITLDDIKVDAYPEVVLWGVRPCDAAGFMSLGAIFNWDYKDNLYNARMEKTTVITFACDKADNHCFCTSVNGGPGNTSGSDIQITKPGDSGDYLAEIITNKGTAIFEKVKELFHKKENPVNKEEYLAKVPVKFRPDEISSRLESLFETRIWQEQSERCLGCGACAYVCPVCACFDIQDEVHGKHGARLRCWDSCGFSLFTLHTSGHNPREKQVQRWRQRLMHKFSYMPERLSVLGCTGCGRCSRACPADMNILEHLISIQEVQK